MDKETLSNYGWIVICILVLSVMIALATPFGRFIATGFENTYVALTEVANGEDGNRILEAAGLTASENDGSGNTEQGGSGETDEGATIVCDHSAGNYVIEPINNTYDHAAVKCLDCGTDFNSLSEYPFRENHYDCDKDSYCDVCKVKEYENGATLVSCGVGGTYTSNEDATHTLTCKFCNKETIYDCQDLDNDGVCNFCKYDGLKVEEVITYDNPEITVSANTPYVSAPASTTIYFIVNGTEGSATIPANGRLMLTQIKSALGNITITGETKFTFFTMNDGSYPEYATQFTATVSGSTFSKIVSEPSTVLLKEVLN